MTQQLTFESPLRTEKLRPGWKKVIAPFWVSSERMARRHVIDDFEYDGDSISRLLGPIYVWLKGRFPKSACLHDHLYRYARFAGIEISRRMADLLYRDAMFAEAEECLEGLSGIRRATMRAVYRTRIEAHYAGVRAGGWRGWRRYRRAELAAQET